MQAVARTDVVAFCKYRTVIALGNPAVTGRHGGLQEHAHRHLGGIARRDRVHGM
jgi:hypothetical protein